MFAAWNAMHAPDDRKELQCRPEACAAPERHVSATHPGVGWLVWVFGAGRGGRRGNERYGVLGSGGWQNGGGSTRKGISLWSEPVPEEAWCFGGPGGCMQRP